MAGTGQVLLIVGAALAAAAAILALLRGHRRLPLVLFGAAAAAIVGATAVLGAALIGGDFSIVYVADTTRRSMGTPYRLAALWGGMEGSLLFWTALLALTAVVAAWRFGAPNRLVMGPDPDDARRDASLVGVPAALTAAFAVITLATANPFRRLAIPATDGAGLLPILEHPAMLYHPPLLYLGLVALVPPFALTIEALRTGALDNAWRAHVRRWLFVPWVLLAIGMVAGANWAYVELGWGGYWAWDPIENTALLPWLAVTAFLHHSIGRRSDRVQGTRDTGAPGEGSGSDVFGAALVLLAFLLAVLGTLLTRSGAATSVHAFAQATAVGRALLLLVIALVGLSGWLLLRARRRAPTPRLTSAGVRATGVRTLGLRVQVGLVLAVTALVLAGTLAPVVRSMLGGETTAIDGSYFATFTIPLVWAGLVLLALVPGLPRNPTPAEIVAIGRVPALLGLGTAALIAWAGWTAAVTLVTGGLAAMAGSSAIVQLVRVRRTRTEGTRAPSRATRLAPHIAHLGFAVLLLGIAGSTAATSRTVLLATGQTTTVGGVTIRNDGVRVDDGDEPKIVTTMHVARGSAERDLSPAIIGYPTLGTRLAETALWSDPLGDVQLALRTADDNGHALVDIHVRPLAPLVWWGGILLVGGGLLGGGGAWSERRAERRSAQIPTPPPVVRPVP